MIKNDLTGNRYGRLTVVEVAGKAKDRHTLWKCRCDCGNDVVVSSISLTSGKTKSCGCLKAEATGNRRRTHGGSTERLYTVWEGIKKRCYSPSCPDYKDYGAKGVKMCEEWHDYGSFRSWALANGYNPEGKYGECTIDRINPYKDYEPSNCRWIPNSEQARNKRSNYKEEDGVRR